MIDGDKLNPLEWLARPKKTKTTAPVMDNKSDSMIEVENTEQLINPTKTLERPPIMCGVVVRPEEHIINEEDLPKPSIEPLRKITDTNEQNPILLKISKETLNPVGMFVRDGESLINNKYPDSVKLEEHTVFKDKSYILTKKSNPKQSIYDKFTTQTIEETLTTQAKIDLTSYLKLEHIVNNYNNELDQIAYEQSRMVNKIKSVSKYKLDIYMEPASMKQRIFSDPKPLKVTLYVNSLEQYNITKELFNILSNVILLGPNDSDGDWLDFLRNSMK